MQWRFYRKESAAGAAPRRWFRRQGLTVQPLGLSAARRAAQYAGGSGLAARREHGQLHRVSPEVCAQVLSQLPKAKQRNCTVVLRCAEFDVRDDLRRLKATASQATLSPTGHVTA